MRTPNLIGKAGRNHESLVFRRHFKRLYGRRNERHQMRTRLRAVLAELAAQPLCLRAPLGRRRAWMPAWNT